jgi:hypothetical protein
MLSRYSLQAVYRVKKSERLRNELVDMVFVACATYFDGILSKENKVNDIYEQVTFMLRHVFVSRSRNQPPIKIHS